MEQREVTVSSSGELYVDSDNDLAGVSVNNDRKAIVEIKCPPEKLIVENFNIVNVDFRLHKIRTIIFSNKLKAKIIRWLINKWL